MPRSNKETKLSFETLSRRSNQVANFLRAQGLKRGDHLLLLLGNVVPLWETMLAAIKLGVVVIPATTLLTPDELRDRLDRGRAKVGGGVAGPGREIRRPRRRAISFASWSARRRAMKAGCRSSRPRILRSTFTPDGPTNADDPMLLYFTSGTTAKPKLVRHSQRSYPGRRRCRRCTGSGCSPATSI